MDRSPAAARRISAFDHRTEGEVYESTYKWVRAHWPAMGSSEATTAALQLHCAEPGQMWLCGAAVDGEYAKGPRCNPVDSSRARGISMDEIGSRPVRRIMHGAPLPRLRQILAEGVANSEPTKDKKWNYKAWGPKRGAVYGSEWPQVAIGYPFHVAVGNEPVGIIYAKDTYKGKPQLPARLVLDLVCLQSAVIGSFPGSGIQKKGYPVGQQVLVDESHCFIERVRMFPFRRPLVSLRELGEPMGPEFLDERHFNLRKDKDKKNLDSRIRGQIKWIASMDFELKDIMKSKPLKSAPARRKGSNDLPYGSGKASGTKAKRRARLLKLGFTLEGGVWHRPSQPKVAPRPRFGTKRRIALASGTRVKRIRGSVASFLPSSGSASSSMGPARSG